MTTSLLNKIIPSLLGLMFFSIAMWGHGIALITETGTLLELSESHVDVQIDNQISIVKSTQIFINKTGEDINIKYGFPMPADANPLSIRWRLDDGVWKEAEVNSSNQDTNIPITNGSSGSGTVSNSDLNRYLGNTPLFFIPADDIEKGVKIAIEVTYVQLLPYSFGKVSFTYPYDYSIIQFDALNNQSFNLDLYSERTIDATNFFGLEDIVAAENNNHTNISFQGEYERAKSDLAFTYELSSDELGLTSFSTLLEPSSTRCDSHGQGFVSMIIEPENNEQVDVIEKNFTLIIDKSGSMSGNKIVQARDAAKFIVNNLNEGDNFNIINFSSGVNSLYDGHEAYSEETKDEALAFINQIKAQGSTNISESLVEAIDQFEVVDQEKANIIIFFTDGEATAGVTSTDGILNEVTEAVNVAETSVFLFTFGIGSSIDEQLLTLLAINNNGLANFLENQDLEDEITSFFLKINNPVLVNTVVELEPNVVTQIYPSYNDKLPNLYKGQQLIISGRYSGKNAGDIVNMKLSGNAYNLPVTYEFPVMLSDTQVLEKTFLPKIWAKQKIDALTVDFYLEGDVAKSNLIQEEIDTLSVCYGVVSLEFNSFVDAGVLEVDLISFDVRNVYDDEVLITWSTAIEINSDYFVIERSNDAREWQEIGREKGAGNATQLNSYTYTDMDPLQGISYYRLKEVDLNGSVSYSEIRVVNINSSGELTIFPNPVLEGMPLYIDAGVEEEIFVTLVDPFGKQVLVENFKSGRGMILFEEIPSGVYICQVKCGNQSKSVKIFIE